MIHRTIPYSASVPEKFKHKLPLASPVSGVVVPLTGVSDIAVKTGVWGEGLAIKTRSSSLASPVEGKLEKLDLDSQRWFIRAKNGLRIMLQLGPVNSPLYSERLNVLKRENGDIKKGDILTYFDPVFLEKTCGQCFCIFTVLNRKGITALVREENGTRLSSENTALYVYI